MFKYLNKVILLLLLITPTLWGQEYLKWRWSHDPIMKNVDASAAHFMGSWILADKIEYTTKYWWKADAKALMWGTLWEVKDALVPWERIGVLGGEGFSWGDITMDASGIAVNRIGTLFWNRWKYKEWDFHRKVKPVNVGVMQNAVCITVSL